MISAETDISSNLIYRLDIVVLDSTAGIDTTFSLLLVCVFGVFPRISRPKI
jgi:hypothetical protein